jgi:hypothetical protein
MYHREFRALRESAVLRAWHVADDVASSVRTSRIGGLLR